MGPSAGRKRTQQKSTNNKTMNAQRYSENSTPSEFLDFLGFTAHLSERFSAPSLTDTDP
jgi:hypothetical protein